MRRIVLVCRHDQLYIDIAHRVAYQSYDEEIKVGSIIVKDGNILSMGYNGTPSGMDNETRHYTGVTKDVVIHSEANALMKLAKAGGSADGATFYCTHSPCSHCSLLLLQAGITKVIYTYCYDESSVLFLKERGIQLDRIEPSDRISPPKGEEDKSKQSQSKQRRGIT